MPPSLPDAIARFFEHENAADPAGLSAWFTADATVQDEGGTMQGGAAIERWMAEAKAKYQQTARPLSAEERDGWSVVTAEVAGQFPGSPIELAHAFRLDGGKIAHLKIG
jgi:protocatechuate 3,4-dioxygenase beta subunit